MHLLGADNSELMEISAIERDGSVLVIKGKVFGTMPMTARLSPKECRAGLKLMSWRMMLFLLSLPFRR